MQPLVPGTKIFPTAEKKQELIQLGLEHGLTADDIQEEYDRQFEWETWLNDEYVVHMKAAGDMTILSIRRQDRTAVHDWRDLQAIKNQLVGPECEAVELYPAESRLLDTANQFYLWCTNDPTFRFPFGFNRRMVSDTSTGGSVQGPHEQTA